MHDHIIIRGATEHNLKSVDLDVPRKRFVVFTGPSGSGKSSLAFDTLFAEGQRRYVESLSVYARQFVSQLEKPGYTELIGLSPTVSIEQKSISHNPRSTVGTITEVHDHLRVLYARLGVQHCHSCGDEVGRVDPQQIARTLIALPEGTKFLLLAPLVRNRKGEFRDLFARLRSRGFVRARIDGEVVELSGLDKVRKQVRHTIDVVVDRLVARERLADRIRDSVATALEIGEGRLLVHFDSGPNEGTEKLYSTDLYCSSCDLAFPVLTQQSFSFNSPLGMCPTCRGLGVVRGMDPDRVVPDRTLSISKGAVKPLAGRSNKAHRTFKRLFDAWIAKHEVDRRAPWSDLPEHARHVLLHGADEKESLLPKGRKRAINVKFQGVLDFLDAQYRVAETDNSKAWYEQWTRAETCDDCDGSRLRSESRAVRFADRSIVDLSTMAISDARAHLVEATLDGDDATIGGELLDEIRARLGFLENVGVGYLSLHRAGPTLSGGEAQRIRLASQLGSELTGVLYVLDEPSIGLHQRDNRKLIETLTALRDRGNSVIVVEHDRETMEAADFVVDFGPGAGAHGGEVTWAGSPDGLTEAEGNVTGDYLSGRKTIAVPETRREGNGALVIRGARANNLQDLDVRFPIGTFTCVTGVSGAGKSTLVNGILYPAIANRVYEPIREVAAHDRIEGIERIDKIIRIDQQPIGRTPRSNPATYTKVFDDIRDMFSKLPESRMYGYKKGRFSFNVAGGRCEECQGAGRTRIEMGFLSDVYVRCETCRGKRFNDATLRVRYRGQNISDVLSMPISDAAELFDAHPKIRRRLDTLVDVGLGYIQLGQPSTTLSGGEAQRVKLSRELAKIATGDTMYILDEPSTGLHFDDIAKLLKVVDRLVEAGNTVVMVEHNLDIIKVADHVIDLGPEGGAGGGAVVAFGTPEQVATVAASHTGRFLAAELGMPEPA